MSTAVNSHSTLPDADQQNLLLMLGVCPLLAVSDTMSGAIGLGIAVIVTLVAARVISLIASRMLKDEWRLAATTMIVAGVAAAVLMIMHAQFPMLYQVLGIFPLLVAANAAVSTSFFLSSNSPARAVLASAKLGLQIAALLVALGIARELVGRGSVFHDAGNQFGEWARSLQLFRADMGFLLAMLPPGAFISLGLMLAARNWLLERRRDDKKQK
jgi:electron transport complex protein RnfE